MTSRASFSSVIARGIKLEVFHCIGFDDEQRKEIKFHRRFDPRRGINRTSLENAAHYPNHHEIDQVGGQIVAKTSVGKITAGVMGMRKPNTSVTRSVIDESVP